MNAKVQRTSLLSASVFLNQATCLSEKSTFAPCAKASCASGVFRNSMRKALAFSSSSLVVSSSVRLLVAFTRFGFFAPLADHGDFGNVGL
jgi:hypothetical protein